jgi:hypothetical protein
MTLGKRRYLFSIRYLKLNKTLDEKHGVNHPYEINHQCGLYWMIMYILCWMVMSTFGDCHGIFSITMLPSEW